MAVSGVSVSTPSALNAPGAVASKTGGAALSDKAQLNLASSVLTQDVIDSLKEADESQQIEPLNTKIEQNNLKKSDLAAITTLVSNFKTSYADVANETALLKRSVDIGGSKSVNANIEAGVKEQTVRMSVSQLAQVDSFQTKGFESRSAVLDSSISGTQKLTLKVGDKSFDLDVTNTTTLEDISDQINDKSDGKITASIIDTGDKNGAFKLVFQTKESGVDNAISFSVAGGEDEKNAAANILDKLGFGSNATEKTDDSGAVIGYDFALDFSADKGAKQLQTAQDAKFTFNGIDITRSSNTIEDLIIGAKFTLNEVDEMSTTGVRKESIITIGRDTEGVVESLKDMVQAYNDLMSNIDTATSYNKDTGAVGSLNGVNEITRIKREINNVMNATINGKAITDFGFEFSDSGTLSLNEDKLKTAMNDDFDGFKNFFISNTTYNNANVYSSGSLTSPTSAISQGVTGKLTINGKEINIDLAAGDSVKNATELVRLINDAGIDNIKASISPSGSLLIAGSYGKNVEIGGDDSVLAILGLKKGTTQGSSTQQKGFFAQMNDVIDGLINKSTGSLTTLANSYEEKGESIAKQKEKTQEMLDKRYAMMQQQFATYAVQMNSLENSFKNLQNTFEALLNNDK